MSTQNNNYSLNCTSIALIASVIIGIITAFLRITAVITVTPAFLWVLLGVAVVYLAVVLLTSAFVNRFSSGADCVASALTLLLIGILGTALFSVVLLAIEFVATSVIGAIITGALLLFFSLMLSETVCLARCLFWGKD